MESDTRDYRLERWIAIILSLLFLLPFVAQGEEIVYSLPPETIGWVSTSGSVTAADRATDPARTSATFELGEEIYDVRCLCDAHADPEGFVDCTLLLEHNGVQQALLRFPAMDEGGIERVSIVERVTFAGDLDRDGRLDLIADVSGQWNEWRVALFLSSAAEEGELVAQVAEFKTWGG